MNKYLVKTLKEYNNCYNQTQSILQCLTLQKLEYKNNLIVLPQWHTCLTSYGGDCVDNSFNLYNRLRSNNVCKIFYCEGIESKFFNSNSDNHAFLLLKINNIDYVLDPSLQVFEKLETSGYMVRYSTKSINTNRPEERGLELCTNIKSLTSSQTGVIGLTEDRNFAVSIGFVKTNHKIKPFLKFNRGSGRFYTYLTRSNNIKFIQNTNKAYNSDKDIIKLTKMLVGFADLAT